MPRLTSDECTFFLLILGYIRGRYTRVFRVGPSVSPYRFLLNNFNWRLSVAKFQRKNPIEYMIGWPLFLTQIGNTPERAKHSSLYHIRRSIYVWPHLLHIFGRLTAFIVENSNHPEINFFLKLSIWMRCHLGRPPPRNRRMICFERETIHWARLCRLRDWS